MSRQMVSGTGAMHRMPSHPSSISWSFKRRAALQERRAGAVCQRSIRSHARNPSLPAHIHTPHPCTRSVQLYLFWKCSRMSFQASPADPHPSEQHTQPALRQLPPPPPRTCVIDRICLVKADVEAKVERVALPVHRLFNPANHP